MALDSTNFLLWALKDVRDRHLRFIAGLREVRRTSEPGERGILEEAVERMLVQLRSYQKRLDDGLNSARAEDADPRAWTIVRPDLAALAKTGFQLFSTTQQSLFPFLPLDRRPPGNITTFVARGFGLEPTREAHRQLFTLSFGRFTSWEGGGIERPSRSVASIPIPFTETLTPLRWPLLVHELAHWHLPGGRPLEVAIEEALTTEFGPRDRRLASTQRAFDELLADTVAYRAYGAAYVMALGIEAHLTSPAEEPDATAIELSPRARLARVVTTPEHRDLVTALPADWALDYGTDFDDALLDRLQAVCDLLLQHFPPRPTDSEIVSRARSLLNEREAACGVQMPELAVEDGHFSRLRGLEALLAADGEDDADDPREEIEALQRALFAAAIDRPCADAEILEAAWMLNLDVGLDGLVDELTSHAALDQTDVAVSKLANADTSVSRSLQAAEVHRWLLEWDERIRTQFSSATDLAAEDHPPLRVEPGTPESPWVESAPLSDRQLLRRLVLPSTRRLVVRPLIDPGQIGGTTIDLRLGTEWEVLRSTRFHSLDPGAQPAKVAELMDASVEEYRLTVGTGQSLVLHPGELLLALTLEYLSLPSDLWGNLEGRSTWARLGLQVHATAGMVDCGFRGYLTLELQNLGRVPLVLYPGLRVGQLALFPVAGVLRPYDEKPTAAYSAQTSARTAFPRQHEHEALHRFFEEERRLSRINENLRFQYGTPAPVSGIYECDCPRRHQYHVAKPGEVLPTVVADCSGASWLLHSLAD